MNEVYGLPNFVGITVIPKKPTGDILQSSSMPVKDWLCFHIKDFAIICPNVPVSNKVITWHELP